MQKKISTIIDLGAKTIQRCCCLIMPNDRCSNEKFFIKRSKIVLLIILIIIVCLIFRLFFLLFSEKYKHKNYNKKQPGIFSRTEIFDRNGKILVSNINIYDLYLQSSRMSDVMTNIKKINKIIPNAISDEKSFAKKLEERRDNNKIVFVKKAITLGQRQKLMDNEVEGLFFEEGEKRFYQNTSTNSIVGYCVNPSKCISGIEKSMNSYIREKQNEPLRLSVDVKIQNIFRDIINDKMILTESKGATGLIMKINTGELIAAVSLPECNYNDYSSCTDNDLFNRYSYGIYELGSVFKLFSVALALKSGISPYKQYERKAYKIDDNYTIHDLDKKEQNGGKLNLIEMTKISSNVGFSKLIEDIDLKEQVLFFSNLGLLKKIDTEIPELSTPIYPLRWTFTNAVTISYGHGIAVSPLHYVSALASLLKNSPVRPTFLATKTDEENYNIKYLNDSQFEIFKDIMRQVVNAGGGKKAYIDEYDIGGKTGTAIQVENGKYNKHSMVLSFVTALPMYDPQYIFFIMLERPKVNDTNNNIVRASYALGDTMKTAISIIGPILNIHKI